MRNKVVGCLPLTRAGKQMGEDDPKAKTKPAINGMNARGQVNDEMSKHQAVLNHSAGAVVTPLAKRGSN